VLKRYRKHAFAICAVLGAVLTPSPDPLSMCVIFIPMYLLYELGLWLIILVPASRILGTSNEKEQEETGGPADGP
jgi:sec-independent protein translocase protein TatC